MYTFFARSEKEWGSHKRGGIIQFFCLFFWRANRKTYGGGRIFVFLKLEESHGSTHTHASAYLEDGWSVALLHFYRNLSGKGLVGEGTKQQGPVVS